MDSLEPFRNVNIHHRISVSCTENIVCRLPTSKYPRRFGTMLTRAKRRRLEEQQESSSVTNMIIDAFLHSSDNGTDQESIIRRTPHKLQLQGSPFDYLPDEIILKILKMASRSSVGRWTHWPTKFITTNTYDDSFIIKELAVISARFERICRDKSLWKDCVELIIGRGGSGYAANQIWQWANKQTLAMA